MPLSSINIPSFPAFTEVSQIKTNYLLLPIATRTILTTMAAPNRRPEYDTSGTGGNADAHYGCWRGSGGQTVTGGNGTGGNIQMPAGCADANIKMTGIGGNARANAGGAARGGDARGGNLTIT
ncbi:hypothetical protein AtubIFM54640_010576 [Aspergillus tubingensis]|uniref:Uncharacterized protein n=2 Tax=Aspergillus subgen. Circumdati TaxID=2720871 RepID=A0A100IE82_ASPNG|nr:hypothetical protein AKAW_03552 [Aspergillus niger]GLA59455.1 hypothetical protein AtubIFM54640_010576 [Aspergillus tubingensis]